MHPFAAELQTCVGRIVLGKEATVALAIQTMLAGGHLLIEDRPGVGKTLLARALARALDLPFQRLQCTADLLPADIVGANVYDPRTGAVTFRPGPVFTSVLVADELNRTPPRTQSALLECMEEGRVTVDRTTHRLPDPFFVVATQNPMHATGTYPLPENQLDRFLMRVRLGYPDPEIEAEVLQKGSGHLHLEELAPVGDAERLRAARAEAERVSVHGDVAAYIVALAQATRASGELRLGVSPRGAQALHRAARARAWCHGRAFVTPDDVRALLVPVFAHRIVLKSAAQGGTGAAEAILAELAAEVAVPR